MKKTLFAISLILLLWVSGFGELKRFFKYYPWGLTDTTTDAWQRQLAWERSKGFDFILEGAGSYPDSVFRLLYDRPRITMYRADGDTEWFNAQAVVRPGKIDSMYAFFNRNGYDIKLAFCHWDSTRIWDSVFYEAWDDGNDTNSDGVRDYTPALGLVTSYQVNNFSDSLQSWTQDEWQGWGIYDLVGGLIDTVDSNTATTVWYDVADTTNLVLTEGFETGDSLPDDWIRYGDGRIIIDTDNPHSGTYSVKVNGYSAYTDVGVKQTILTSDQTNYIFRAWYRTDGTYLHGDTTRPLVQVTRADSESYHISRYWIPIDSADGNWHLFVDTFSSYIYGDWQESMTVVLGAFPEGLSDTTWDESDSIFFDDIELFAVKGIPPTWTSTGDFGENVVYRPYVIDHPSCSTHIHTAIAESLSRAVSLTGQQYGVERLANIGYDGYRYFQKWWSAILLESVRSAFNPMGIMGDEQWHFIPVFGRYWLAEYKIDSIYKADGISLNEMIHDTLNGLGYYYIINSLLDTSFSRTVDGILSEGQDYPEYANIAATWDSLYGSWENYPYTGFRNNIWRHRTVADQNKLQLYYSYWNPFEQKSSYEAITRYDRAGHLGDDNTYLDYYENSMAGRNRARMSSLAWYYQIASDSTYYWYEIQYGYLPMEYYWSDMLDVDIGEPVDTVYLFASGKDADSISYIITARKFVGGTGDTVLTLVKHKSYGTDWWGCYASPPCSVSTYNTTDTLSWDTHPATTHNLDGYWFKFKWDGRFEPGFYSTIDLLYNEGVILCKICEE